MKYVTTLLLFASSLFAFSQSTHQITLSASNNGQLGDFLHEHSFLIIGPYEYTLEKQYKLTSFKANLGYELITPSNYAFTGRLGYAVESSTFENSGGFLLKGTISQNVYQIAVGAKRVWNADKFQISSGLELPFFMIADNKAKQTTSSTESNYSYSGGIALGLNNVTSFRCFLTDKLYLSTELVIGVIYSKLDGKVSATSTNLQTGKVSDMGIADVSTVSNLFISKPEFLFGVGFKL
jgi:hypothetical protein